MMERVLTVVGVVLVLVTAEVWRWKVVFERRRKTESLRDRITYRYEPRATGTEGVPRYEAGTDVAGTVQFSAHTQGGRS